VVGTFEVGASLVGASLVGSLVIGLRVGELLGESDGYGYRRFNIMRWIQQQNNRQVWSV